MYRSVGGKTGVDALVDEFYERVLSDDELAPFFKGARIDRLRRMQAEFFAAALGGPVDWNGTTVARLHRHRGIGAQHFHRFIEHLVETLAHLKLTSAERSTIVQRISDYAPDVTTQS